MKDSQILKGYIRISIDDNGDCGYTAFGVTREKAYELLTEHLGIDPTVQTLLGSIAKEFLIQDDFIRVLQQKGILDTTTERKTIESSLDLYSQNLEVLQACIDYDILEKHGPGIGWAHPAILQALAHIQGCELYIWRLRDDQELIPHRGIANIPVLMLFPHYEFME